MEHFVSILASLSGADCGKTRSILSDFAELLNRHHFQGTNPNFAFDDSSLAKLPARIEESRIAQIVEHVAPLLLDSSRPEDIRAQAAFVLGKTNATGLREVLKALTSTESLPWEVARQCAFAFDALSETEGSSSIENDPRRAEEGFLRNNIPWDSVNQRVMVDDL